MELPSYDPNTCKRSNKPQTLSNLAHFKDTHREKLCFYSIEQKNDCLAASDLFSYVYTIN